MHCPTIPSWIGATLNTTDTLVETYVNVSCREDLVIPNRGSSQVVQCTASGEWQPSLLSCQQPAIKTINLVPTESDAAKDIGIITLAVVGCIGVLVFISDIPTIVMQLRQSFSIVKAFLKL